MHVETLPPYINETSCEACPMRTRVSEALDTMAGISIVVLILAEDNGFSMT